MKEQVLTSTSGSEWKSNSRENSASNGGFKRIS